MKKKLVITIDGPSGAGKTSAARSLAKRLGYLYLDTGALYRAVGWKVLNEKIDINNEEEIGRLCSSMDIRVKRDNDNNMTILVDDIDITNEIRRPEVSRVTSIVSALKVVRERLMPIQKQTGKEGGVVIEGRDTGTIMFPDADIKFFLNASVEERGKRRWEELTKSGEIADLSETIKEIKLRDKNDSERKIAPLKMADDAILIDTTDTKPSEVIEKMFEKLSRLL